MNSALRETVQRYHSPIRLNQYLQTVPVEINSRRQAPGDDLIQRVKETQNTYGRCFSRFMAAVHKWVRWNRSRTVGSFLLKRLFMLPRHPRQYTPSFVPNPSLGPGVLGILVCPRIDVCSISAFLSASTFSKRTLSL